MQEPNYARSFRQILDYAARQKIQELGAKLAELRKRTVMSGPFAGMVLPNGASWGDGDLAPKMLGVYEAELHGAIERAISRAPDLVINVGCAEGYYAVGLARRLPNAQVHAFDISEAAQEVCRAAAAENGVGDRVQVSGRCEGADLVRLAGQAERVLMVIDCEGYERQLLTDETVAALGHCDLIVECHDFLDASITPGLLARLSPAHDTEQLREGARDPSAFTELRGLNSLDRLLCVCEFRPQLMYWVTGFSKAR